MSLVLRVEPLRSIIPSAAEESQHRICRVVAFVSSAPRPNFSSQFHCCRRSMPLQAPGGAATNSASPLLSAIVDCFLLDEVIGYQPSVPCTHDAVPLTLNRLASPAQSESPYAITEPSRALLTASRLNVVGHTVMIPGVPRRYRRIDLMFLMSCRSHVQGLMRPSSSHSAGQVGQFIKVSKRVVGRLFARFQASPSHRSHGVPTAVGVVLSADMLNSYSMLSTYAASTPKLYTSFVLTRCRPS